MLFNQIRKPQPVAAIRVILFVFILIFPAGARAEENKTPQSSETTVNGRDPAEDSRRFGEFLKASAPSGYVAVFGGKKPRPGSTEYEAVRDFARLWSADSGAKYPIATNGNAGVGDAANFGASEVHRPSFAFPLVGTSDGTASTRLIHRQSFSDYSQRISDVVDQSRGMVFAHPDLETYWTILEVVTKIVTKQMPAIPLVLLGPDEEWKPLFDLLATRIKRGVVAPETPAHLHVAKTAQEAFDIVKKGMSPAPSPALLSPDQIRKDVDGIKKLIAEHAPNGMFTVFGGWRVKKDDPFYELARKTAWMFRKRSKGRIPTGSGGGPGIMEAANEGGGGLGFPMGTLASKQHANPFVEHSYTSIAFSQREGLMIDYSQFISYSRGGNGTTWEWFEMLAKKQVGWIPLQMAFLLGPDAEWEELRALMGHLEQTGEITPADWSFVRTANDPATAMRLIPQKLIATATCDLARLAPRPGAR